MMQLDSVLSDAGVSNDDLQKAKAYQNKFGGALERLLVNMGSLSEEELPIVYSRLLGLEIYQLNEADYTLDEGEQLPFDLTFLLSRGWILLGASAEEYTFATKNPLDLDTNQYLQKANKPVRIKVASEPDFEQLAQIRQQENVDIGQGELLTDGEEDRLRELASEAPTVNLLNSLISRALRQGASDMHLEPYQGRYRVRFRIDGVLHDIEHLPARLQTAVISRLKILSNMDIAEKRRPQDGKIELKIANIELDIRVSALPLNDGESMVLRFLRKDSVRYDMDVLGLSTDIYQKISEDLRNTAGVILLTGPTGSGKTTTLYTFLNELNNEDVKIITLEDPVEYQLDGINQVQVNPDIDFDFSAGLRSIVRQDPDIIMVGEIRDKETASIAMQSALTGHLVFSTVHTNDAPGAYTRLLDLGVEEFLLNAALVSVIAQRLVRKLCPHCSVEVEDQNSLINKYSLDSFVSSENITLKRAVGCEECANSGYKGRMAIIEYLRCDEAIRAIPKDENFLAEAKRHNHSVGGRTLLEDGLLKAANGLTTIDEVLRVCG